ncbi:hypothetical protein VRB12_15415 [Pseudomonas poae]|uniref:Uncharacterized protein n=2 Tax=Pseudomonas poae TaxID=200451 RepID=A0AAP2S5P3_9PSED|nr:MULTISPECIES: hypothetical protein [Pseudomonas]AGE26385.1 hypothetical protein H045_11600 [Pseudomonas poae RE*1-1-14]MCF5657131.1 hypothetical protein [Pseudomonas poae]
MEVKATVIVWLPEYELWRLYYTEVGQNLDAKLLQGREVSSLTRRWLENGESDSRVLFLKDPVQSGWAAFIGQWSFATMRAIKQYTVFISLKPCQGNWQKKDPAKEPGQKP